MSEAYEKVRKEIDGVAESELVHINIDIPSAIATAFGVLPSLRSLRPRIEAETKGVNLKLLDKLETYVLALFHAQTLYATASKPAEPLPELVEAATSLRDTLYSDAMALVNRGLLDPEQLRGVKTQLGYRPLAFDLTSVAEVMRAGWDQIKSKTAVQPAELAEATSLAERLLTAVGEREMAPAAVAEAGVVRQRAFTLFVRAYDELRRAMTFLRWREGDADKLAPSLYAGRGGSGRRKSEDEPESAPGAEPAPVPTVPATSGGTPEPGTMTGAPAVAPGAPAGGVAAGMPGSDPYAAA